MEDKVAILLQDGNVLPLATTGTAGRQGHRLRVDDDGKAGQPERSACVGAGTNRGRGGVGGIGEHKVAIALHDGREELILGKQIIVGSHPMVRRQGIAGGHAVAHPRGIGRPDRTALMGRVAALVDDEIAIALHNGKVLALPPHRIACPKGLIRAYLGDHEIAIALASWRRTGLAPAPYCLSKGPDPGLPGRPRNCHRLASWRRTGHCLKPGDRRWRAIVPLSSDRRWSRGGAGSPTGYW